MDLNDRTSEKVEAFLAALEHPLKQEVIALREIILSADPAIREDIKWNVPSFRTSEYFATFHLRAQDRVQVILHLGAKVRDGDIPGFAVDDPQSLLNWLGTDRASVTFRDGNDVRAKETAFQNIIRQWIRHV